MKQKLTVAIISILLYSNITCRSEIITDTLKPGVGHAMPDFNLDYITHFKSKTASLKDFKGKWLFLDFWFPGCTTCILSFPKVNSYAAQFKNQLTWMLVGLNDTKYNKGIEAFYEKARTRQKLEMPVAYDSVLVTKWDIHAMPYIIVVDPQGIVRFITDGRDMTSQKIASLLRGEKVTFFDLIGREEIKQKLDSADTTDSSRDIIYSSVLKKSGKEKLNGGVEVERWITWPTEYLTEGYSFGYVSLAWLYKHAYFGKPSCDYNEPCYNTMYPNLLLEVDDPSLFDLKSPDAKYDYELKLPVAHITKEHIMQAMQDDLKRAFGYKVSIETREIPVWKLVAKPEAIEKLKTKGGKKYSSSGSHAMGFTVRNQPAYYLIGFVTFYIQGMFYDPYMPFIDATGLKDNFDLALDIDMTNFDEVQKALRKKGLELIKGTQTMQQLVIRD